MVDRARVNQGFLEKELGYLPPAADWGHVIWGRGSADQLGGVVCQVLATKVMRELRKEGALRGVVVHSYATVCEEDNDGAGPMFIMRKTLPGAGPERIPDAVVLTEGTGCAHQGALGLYRGQRGRMQIEVVVTGKSCHGSMPWEGKNPLEWASRILVEATEAHEQGRGFLDDAFLGKGTRTASFAALETPSDCAVPERFTFRFDRRLTVGESPDQAVKDVDALPAVAKARAAGVRVDVRVPTYDDPSWKGVPLGNPQIYAGWLTPEDHPAIQAALATYRSVCTPLCWGEDQRGQPRREPRLSRWIFSTDGVGFPLRVEDPSVSVPARKGWVTSKAFKHPAMFGIGPGIEQNTHKIGESLDARELAPVIAFYARFPSLYHARR
jgi:putative selenium metabolism hydrolase